MTVLVSVNLFRKLVYSTLNLLCIGVLGFSMNAAAQTMSVTTAATALPARLQQLTERLAAQPVLRAQFTQTKTVQGLQRPLVSTGQFVLMQRPLAEGVLWRIEQPLQLSYWLTEQSMTEIQANGQRQTRRANELPAFSQIGRIFSGLMRLNQRDLQQYFTWEYKERSPDQETWILILHPNIQLASVIRQIRLGGKQYLEWLEIDEANQDKLRIQLSRIQPAAQLTADERQLIGLPEGK